MWLRMNTSGKVSLPSALDYRGSTPMPDDAYRAISSFFQSAAQQLLADARQSATLGNSTAIGSERETSIERTLKRLLPPSCEVLRGGYLFDLEGNSSRQIDIIVLSGTTPRFAALHGGQAFAPIEGTIAVCEVKSRLDKERLIQALDNFAALPVLKHPEATLPRYIKKPNTEFWWDLPYKAIFAFDAIDSSLLCQYLNEYYQQHANVPPACRPTMIHALNRYVVMRMTSGMTVYNADGSAAPDQPEVGEYHSFTNQPDTMGLVWLIAKLQGHIFFANHMRWQYDQWINQLADRVSPLSAREC